MARTLVVDRLRDDILSSARLTAYQYRFLCQRNPLYLFIY